MATAYSIIWMQIILVHHCWELDCIQQGCQTHFHWGHSSLEVAFKGPNVNQGLCKCNYSLTVKQEFGAATGQKQGAGLDKTRWRVGFGPRAWCLPPVVYRIYSSRWDLFWKIRIFLTLFIYRNCQIPLQRGCPDGCSQQSYPRMHTQLPQQVTGSTLILSNYVGNEVKSPEPINSLISECL